MSKIRKLELLMYTRWHETVKGNFKKRNLKQRMERWFSFDKPPPILVENSHFIARDHSSVSHHFALKSHGWSRIPVVLNKGVFDHAAAAADPSPLPLGPGAPYLGGPPRPGVSRADDSAATIAYFDPPPLLCPILACKDALLLPSFPTEDKLTPPKPPPTPTQTRPKGPPGRTDPPWTLRPNPLIDRR